MILLTLSVFDWCAIIGAITGITSCVYNYYQWKNDCGKLQCTAQIMQGVIKGVGVTGEHLIIKCVNVGRRPVIVNQAYFIDDKNQTFLLMEDKLPQKLNEAESCILPFSIEAFLKGLKRKQFLKIEKICINDSLGKIWEVPKISINKINNELEKRNK